MSANRVLLVTRSGRLVKTVGLDENLSQVFLPAGDPISQSPHEMRAPASFAMDYDLRRETIESLSISSTIEALGKQRITIADIEFETVLLREKNYAHPTKWTFENRYWVDAYDGFVWKSQQYITPNLPPVQIEVLKPAA